MKKKVFMVVLIPIILLFGCNSNVEVQEKEVSSGIEQEKIYERRYANENCFYVFNNKKGVLQQWIWEKGEMIAEYENLEMEKLLLVTDKNIYFQTLAKGNKKTKKSISVFCIPIQVQNGVDVVDIKDKREIFTIPSEDDIYELSIYDNQIICLTNGSQVFLYNEKKKELQEVREELGSLNFANHMAEPIFKGSIYFTDDKSNGLYELDLKENTKYLEQINNNYINSFVCDKDDAFYSIGSAEKKESAIYNLGKNCIFLKYKDIEHMLFSYKQMKQGTKKYNFIDIDMYVYAIFENRLYFSVEFGYEPYGVNLREKVMLSVDINNCKDVCIEERLNDFLEEVYECSDGAERNGYILEIISGKCLVMGEKGKKFEDSVGVPYIYELREGKKKKLSKKDGEWWYCYYNYPMD